MTDRDLPHRDTRHWVLGTLLDGPRPDNSQEVVIGMGCFWGAERLFWRVPGVYSTAAGYAGGRRPHPTYEQVCSGATGHAEVVQVVFDPATVSFEQLLKVFWENHDPTQGNRQGNDVGSQYRSAIFTTTAEQYELALASQAAFQPVVTDFGHGPITTEITPLMEFFFAENYHQQYLAKNPSGYCNHVPNGMSCPIAVGAADSQS